VSIVTEVQTGYVSINNANLYYEIAGDGHPFVLVHAGVTDNTMWDTQFAEFSMHYRVLRYDMRGYGNSEPVDGEFSHQEDLAAIIKHFNLEHIYLMGCSMGGGNSMDYTLTYPDNVDALIMVGSGPSGLELDVETPALFAEVEKAFNDKDYERVNELESQIWFVGAGRTPDQMDAKARQQFLTMNRKVLAHEIKGLGTRKPPMSPSAAERLHELKLPVLIVYGDRDTQYIQQAAAYMESHIQGAKKVLMPDTAHLPNMERPAEFNQIVLDFLRQTV
jgi:pimeloyl-ACP methyl ester carboxylesterase